MLVKGAPGWIQIPCLLKGAFRKLEPANTHSRQVVKLVAGEEKLVLEFIFVNTQLLPISTCVICEGQISKELNSAVAW